MPQVCRLPDVALDMAAEQKTASWVRGNRRRTESRRCDGLEPRKLRRPVETHRCRGGLIDTQHRTLPRPLHQPAVGERAVSQGVDHSGMRRALDAARSRELRECFCGSHGTFLCMERRHAR